MTSSTIASLEIEELKQERDVGREEVTSLRIEIQNLRAEFQVMLAYYCVKSVSMKNSSIGV